MDSGWQNSKGYKELLEVVSEGLSPAMMIIILPKRVYNRHNQSSHMIVLLPSMRNSHMIFSNSSRRRYRRRRRGRGQISSPASVTHQIHTIRLAAAIVGQYIGGNGKSNSSRSDEGRGGGGGIHQRDTQTEKKSM